MSTKEKRKFERIPNDDLPEVFKTLFVDLGDYKHLSAKTADVSTMGVGIYLYTRPGFFNRINQIVLHSSDNQYQFSGQIANVKKLQDDCYRLGVALNDLK